MWKNLLFPNILLLLLSTVSVMELYTCFTIRPTAFYTQNFVVYVRPYVSLGINQEQHSTVPRYHIKYNVCAICHARTCPFPLREFLPLSCETICIFYDALVFLAPILLRIHITRVYSSRKIVINRWIAVLGRKKHKSPSLVVFGT